jgi:hypothetical protein
VERPVPHDTAADHLGAPDIHAGDPEAAAKQAKARPVRPLAPEDQAPPVEFERKLKKGESYWVVGNEDMPTVRKGRIIRLSDEPGKAVGLEFDEPIEGVNHTCDGRGKQGHCLYARPDQVLDDKAMEAWKAHKKEAQAPSPYEDFDELTVGPQHSQPLTPMIEGREQMTLTRGDVGKLDLSRKGDEDEE